MKAAMLVLLLTVAFQVRADEAADVAALKTLEAARQAAIKTHDFDALRKIYAEDFVAIAGNGSVLSRSDLMEVFARTDDRLTFTVDEIDVRLYGASAIFTGRLTARTASGDVASVGRFTHVFVKRDGAWVCVHGQSTTLASAEAAPERG